MVHSVLVVEDDSTVRVGLSCAIGAAHGLRLVAAASDLPEGMRLLEAHRPDALLVDIGLPGGSGIELIRHARSHVPACECMVVTVFDDTDAVMACIEAGATGYLLKDCLPADIGAQVRLLCEGGSPISPTIARRVMQRLNAHPTARDTDTAPAVEVSAREHSVLELSAKGCSYEEIAGVLGLSHHTVVTYVKRIYRKLQVHSKTEAVYEARNLGILRD